MSDSNNRGGDSHQEMTNESGVVVKVADDKDAVTAEEEEPQKQKNAEADDQKAHRIRQALLVVACLYNFLYVGAFFGWGPMQLLLEENGSLSGKCDDVNSENQNQNNDSTTTSICPEQTAALINIQFAATTTQILSPLLGIICDRYGAPTAAYCMTTCLLTGLVLLVAAVHYHVDALLYVAFLTMSFGTWFGALLMTQTGMYYSGQMQHRVIVSLNSLFDSGAVTYLALWYIYESLLGGTTAVSSVLFGYLIVGIVLLGTGAYLWTVVEPDKGSIYGSINKLSETEHEGELEQNSDNNNNKDAVSKEEGLATAAKAAAPADSSVNIDDDNNNGNEDDDDDSFYVLVRDRTPFEQMTCAPSLLVTVFFVIQCTSNQWAMTTARDFLADLGDDEVDNRYLTIFQLMMPASLLALPLVDHVRQKYGFAAGFQIVNLLAIGYNVIRLASDNLNVQVFGFILFSCYRSFLFGLTFSYIPTLLAQHVIGKATGVIMALPGITSFLNVALTRIALLHLDGDFFVPNLLYTLLTLPCIVAVWFIGKNEKREARALQRQAAKKEAAKTDAAAAARAAT